MRSSSLVGETYKWHVLCITLHYIAQTLEVVSVVADPYDTLFVKYDFIYERDEARQGSGLCNIRNT